jgi:hypothetical protein
MNGQNILNGFPGPGAAGIVAFNGSGVPFAAAADAQDYQRRIRRSQQAEALTKMAEADFFTHNAPDYGEEGDGVLGAPGTSIADRLRRVALLASMQTKRLWQDPLHTIFPTVGPTGATGGHRVGIGILAQKNVGGDWSSQAGQYVGPNDMAAHKTVPGYIPRQDWQNAVRQDPLADLLGPMQKPPTPTPGF